MATIFGLNIKLRNERWPRAESFYQYIYQLISLNERCNEFLTEANSIPYNFLIFLLVISNVNCYIFLNYIFTHNQEESHC